MRQTIDAEWMFDRYEQIRRRLPYARFPDVTEAVADLGVIVDRFDTFIFDSFGVLNIGDQAIGKAVDRIAMLRAAGKQVLVLTNAASVPISKLEQKYRNFGFDFALTEIISSRAVLADALTRFDAAMEWAVIAPDSADITEIPARTRAWDDSIDDNCDGFIFLSISGWNDQRQDILREELTRKPRPLLIGNPDLVAPREDCLTMEPGFYAHEIADRLREIEPEFFGKPFGNAFDFLKKTSIGTINPKRSLMLGDTLHTDILGGRVAGMFTALVTGHGVLRHLDPAACIASSGIVPDYQMPSI